jgi:DNA-binding CsgD family transcriptional regulator
MGNMYEMGLSSLFRQPSVALRERLTPRQLDVLELLCEGLPNKLIGRRLNISSATVKIHVASVLRALNVASRLQAVIVACSLGLELSSATPEPLRTHTVPVRNHRSVLRLVPDVNHARRLRPAVSERSLAAVAG